MDATRCPICKGSAFIPGYVGAGQGNVASMFVPNGMQALRSQVGVGLSSGFFSCLSCGYVWTRLAPDQLRQFIRTNGDELVKQCLDFLEHGPDHDLPDVPEARLAGLGVAEIDALVLAGHLPGGDPQASRADRQNVGRGRQRHARLAWPQAGAKAGDAGMGFEGTLEGN